MFPLMLGKRSGRLRRARAVAGRNTHADRGDLGCTEMGLSVGPEDAEVPLYDTTGLHARAGVTLGLGAA